MRHITLIGLTTLVGVIATASVVRASYATDAADVRAVFNRQTELFKQGRWQAMYGTYTPQYRRRCPFRPFVKSQQRVRRLLGTRFSFRGIRVRVQGDLATVAYRAVSGSGRTMYSVRFADGDTYRRIGDRWYDEYDRVSNC